MADFSIRHEFECDEKTFWEKCTFDEEFNRRLFLEHLKFPGWKCAQEDDGKKIHRKVHVDPPIGNVPGPVKKAMGDKLSYIEEGTYDRSTQKYVFTAIPSTMADKTKTTGELYTEKLGDKRIARIAKLKVEVKVFMIGGMIEEVILRDMKDSYNAAAKFTETFLKEKGY